MQSFAVSANIEVRVFYYINRHICLIFQTQNSHVLGGMSKCLL